MKYYVVLAILKQPSASSSPAVLPKGFGTKWKDDRSIPKVAAGEVGSAISIEFRRRFSDFEP